MKITRQRLKKIIREELSRMNEGGLAGHQTEPRYEGGTPEERLLNKLLIRSKVGKLGDPQRAAEMLGLGDDEEVVEYLADLMGNPMYDEPGSPESEELEEGWGWRDEDSDRPMTNKEKMAEIERLRAKKPLKKEIRSPSPTSRRSVDARRRKKNWERDQDPTYQKVKVATEKHLEKAKKGKSK
jgi:hypothetical protein